nr:MAG TPA: hypothetical protein [Caudoviricetes sp.]
MPPSRSSTGTSRMLLPPPRPSGRSSPGSCGARTVTWTTR